MAIPIVFTHPEQVTFYLVQPHELEQLMKIEKPITLTIASTATGLFLGMIPVIRSAISDLSDLARVKSQDLQWDFGYALLWALSLGVAIVTWIVALKGKTDADKLLEAIKRRPSRPFA